MDYGALKSIIKQYSIIEAYKPGKDLYQEVMKMYNENKNILQQLGIVEQ